MIARDTVKRMIGNNIQKNELFNIFQRTDLAKIQKTADVINTRTNMTEEATIVMRISIPDIVQKRRRNTRKNTSIIVAPEAEATNDLTRNIDKQKALVILSLKTWHAKLVLRLKRRKKHKIIKL